MGDSKGPLGSFPMITAGIIHIEDGFDVEESQSM